MSGAANRPRSGNAGRPLRVAEDMRDGPRSARTWTWTWTRTWPLPLLAALGCNPAPTPRPEQPSAADPAAPAAANCPTAPLVADVAPDVTPRHRRAQTWLDKLPEGAADAVLLDPSARQRHNAHSAVTPGGFRDPLGVPQPEPATVAAEIAERNDYMKDAVAAGRLVEREAGAMAGALAVAASAVPDDRVHWLVDEAQLWCVPLRTGLFKTPIDEAFDRNRCASLHPGELLRVRQRAEDGAWVYVDAGHTTGWLHAPTLSPALPEAHVRPLWTGPHLLPRADGVQAQPIAGRTDSATKPYRFRLGTRLPLRATTETTYEVFVPSPSGPVLAAIDREAPVAVGPLPLTRRALWTMALQEQDKPYGWGGTGGERDCSRYLRDLLVTFGIELARHSGVQAKLGTERIDVAGLGVGAKRAALAEAAARGVVILYMPGHVMLYLGRDEGRDYAVSAISEWLEPCPGGEDTTHRIDRVAVTTLALGRDTERTSFIERITTLVLFAPAATPDAQSPDLGLRAPLR